MAAKKWYQTGTKRLDKLLNQFISKRLSVIILASYFFYIGILDGLYWVVLACIWMIQQGVDDVIKRFLLSKIELIAGKLKP